MIGYEARIEYLEGRLEYQTEKADELKAENKRLREALEEIGGFLTFLELDEVAPKLPKERWGGRHDRLISIARAALVHDGQP